MGRDLRRSVGEVLGDEEGVGTCISKIKTIIIKKKKCCTNIINYITTLTCGHNKVFTEIKLICRI